MIEKKEWERNFMREKEKRRENVFALNRKEKVMIKLHTQSNGLTL